MATTPSYRPYASGRGAAPVTIYCPLEASQSGVPGSLVFDDDSDGQAKIGDANTDLLGILEETVSSSTANDLAQVSLFLPGVLWEFSADDTAAAAAHLFDSHELRPLSSGSYSVVDLAAASASSVTILEFIGYQRGTFETDRFVAAAGTSDTSGASNAPLDQPLGGIGDTYARCLVSVLVGATLLCTEGG